jgi:hypothetical protein
MDAIRFAVLLIIATLLSGCIGADMGAFQQRHDNGSISTVPSWAVNGASQNFYGRNYGSFGGSGYYGNQVPVVRTEPCKPYDASDAERWVEAKGVVTHQDRDLDVDNNNGVVVCRMHERMGSRLVKQPVVVAPQPVVTPPVVKKGTAK